MESLVGILNVSVPLWALLPFAILSLMGQIGVFICMVDAASG